MHTKEPWHVGSDVSDYYSIYGHIGRLAISTGGEASRTTANARRIVDCVNAMQGIPDPAAYVAAMGEVIEAAEATVDRPIYPRIERLEAALTAARAAMPAERQP